MTHSRTILAAAVVLALTACSDSSDNISMAPPAPAPPAPAPEPEPEPDTVSVGMEVFRFETFGNQGFWTDAMRLPQGIAGAGVTPLDALALGLSVNVEALSSGTAEALLDALDQIEAGTAANETVLGDPAVTLALINEGAVIGVVPFDANGDRKPLGSDSEFMNAALDLGAGERIGVSCALCHSVTDNSVVPAGLVGPGSVGAQIDGFIPEGLDVGAIFAASENPLAYLPFLQLSFDVLDGASLGRGDFPGIDSADTVEQQTAAAREYLTGMSAAGMRHYPKTSFDATPDGIGNATYIAPFFRTDLAAPWGSSGAFEELEDFNNLVYTVALDPTSLLTESGRALLNVLAGPVGDEIAERYEDVLRATGVIPEGMAASDVIPFVEVADDTIAAGSPEGPVGRRVDEDRLLALNAYTDQLPSPAAPEDLDPEEVARGEEIFTTARADGGANCTACHTADPEMPVSEAIRPVEQLYTPYDDDLLVLLERSAITEGLSDVQTTLAGPRPDYDLALVVLDASLRGEPRGFAQPLLLGLDDKDEFLHNGSVVAPGVSSPSAAESLDWLLDPARGDDAPHAFYFPRVGEPDDMDGRAALVTYLRSRSAP